MNNTRRRRHAWDLPELLFSCILPNMCFSTIYLITLQILAVIYPASANLHAQIALLKDRFSIRHNCGFRIQRCWIPDSECSEGAAANHWVTSTHAHSNLSRFSSNSSCTGTKTWIKSMMVKFIVRGFDVTLTEGVSRVSNSFRTEEFPCWGF